MVQGNVRVHTILLSCTEEVAEEFCESGIPAVRPLFYHYDEGKAYAADDEYLLGRDMLIAPVLRQGASSRTVYLPDDRWVHAFSGKEYPGGEFAVDAPIGCPPVFVRADSEYKDRLLDSVRNSI